MELEKFLKTIPREHWSGFYLYYERYSKDKSYKTAWYFYKKEYYKIQKRQQERNKLTKQKLGAQP